MLIVLSGLILNISIVLYEIIKYRYVNLKAYFFLLNLAFIVPFFVSISFGTEGFAARRDFGFSFLTFYLYTFQVFLVPIIWFFSERILSSISIEFRQRVKQSKTLLYVLLILLLFYFISYVFVSKSAIYYFIIGDIQEAARMRVLSHVGNYSEETGASMIYNYINLFKPLTLIILGTFIFYYKSFFVKLFFLFIFFIIAFSTFSKGALAGGLLYLFFLYIFINKPKNLLLKASFVLMSILTILTYYTAIVVDTSLENAFWGVMHRFYNNSSSTYLQLEMYYDKIPLFLSVNDWGIIGKILDIDRFIPKEEVYSYIYPTHKEGQGGTFMMADLFFFAGYLYVLPTITTVLFLEFFNKIINEARWVLHNRLLELFLVSFMIYFGMYFVINIFNSPFNIFNPLIGLRIEIWINIFIFIFIFKFSIIKKGEANAT